MKRKGKAKVVRSPRRRSGKTLIRAVQASPHREIEIEPGRSRFSVREVKL
jgi:hypothetical protein